MGRDFVGRGVEVVTVKVLFIYVERVCPWFKNISRQRSQRTKENILWFEGIHKHMSVAVRVGGGGSPGVQVVSNKWTCLKAAASKFQAQHHPSWKPKFNEYLFRKR